MQSCFSVSCCVSTLIYITYSLLWELVGFTTCRCLWGLCLSSAFGQNFYIRHTTVTAELAEQCHLRLNHSLTAKSLSSAEQEIKTGLHSLKT